MFAVGLSFPVVPLGDRSPMNYERIMQEAA